MKKRLTFFTLGEDTFLRDIIINLRPDYDIKFFQRGNATELYQMLHDTDIAWFEWCDQLVAQVSMHPKMCKYICRLHSYEMFTQFPMQVDWNKIDKLVFVSDVVKNYLMSKIFIRPDILTVINNGIDINKFNIPKDKIYNKKTVFVGYINYKKGPELLLQVFNEIHKYDPSFEFHIAGEHQDERIALYFDYMLHQVPFKIHFDGWVKNMPEYLKDKDYIISTSIFESFQYSIAEGMAQGLCPLIHKWLGSDLIYPKENLFITPQECIKIVSNFEESDKDILRNQYRQHIVDNFSFDKQIKEIRHLLETI